MLFVTLVTETITLGLPIVHELFPCKYSTSYDHAIFARAVINN